MAPSVLDGRMDSAFALLLSDLADTWAEGDVEYVRDVAAHAEYLDALENLVAIADRNGKGLSTEQSRRAETLAASMSTSLSAIRAENRRNQQPSASAA